MSVFLVTSRIRRADCQFHLTPSISHFCRILSTQKENYFYPFLLIFLTISTVMANTLLEPTCRTPGSLDVGFDIHGFSFSPARGSAPAGVNSKNETDPPKQNSRPK
ncbi:MAG: hypothetical protein KGL39_52755 [Patescibacteria group bacterium]|nr:hypothetical protein [Patescibacteria group bacterium]